VIAQLAADENLRQREFPICARKIYCAHAADSPLPRRVAEGMRESIARASVDARNYDGEARSRGAGHDVRFWRLGMLSRALGLAAVIDRQSNLAGIVTIEDLIRRLASLSETRA